MLPTLTQVHGTWKFLPAARVVAPVLQHSSGSPGVGRVVRVHADAAVDVLRFRSVLPRRTWEGVMDAGMPRRGP